jgi:membrane-associated phospholipid phosphatase
MKRLDFAARRVAIALSLVLVLLFVVAAWFARHEDFSDLDQGARTLIRDNRVAELRQPMRLISTLATGWVLLPVSLAASALLWRRGRRALALHIPLLGATAVIVLAVTKWIVNKPRPTLRGFGFPSGHVFAASVFVLVAIYLLWLVEASRTTQRLVRVVGIVFVVAVGYSRLYGNAHWFSDVVGGLLAGVAFALAAVLVMDRRLN